MPAKDLYDILDVGGGRALLMRRKFGDKGGWTKVADCRTPAAAQRLLDELNGVDMVHIDDVREALRLLGFATAQKAAEAAAILRIICGEADALDA